MVQSVNMEQVAPEERLSDHVYHYDCKEKLFERTDKYESRKLNQEFDDKMYGRRFFGLSVSIRKTALRSRIKVLKLLVGMKQLL